MTVPSDSDIWRLWFDGSALPNPGRIGIGTVILSPSGQRLEYGAATGQHGCNNQAELLALIAALQQAHEAGARHVEVAGDSDVAIRHVNGAATTQIAALLPLIAQARSWLDRFDSVQLRWIPRHRNSAADLLCRQALGLPPKPASPHGKRSRKRR